MAMFFFMWWLLVNGWGQVPLPRKPPSPDLTPVLMLMRVLVMSNLSFTAQNRSVQKRNQWQCDEPR
jgi:hypothetical protein